MSETPRIPPLRIPPLLSTLWTQEAQDLATLHSAGWLLGSTRWSAQHAARAWEYDRAIKALDEQSRESGMRVGLVLDVGGAGSPFAWIVANRCALPVQIVDPEFNGLGLGNLTGTIKRRPLELQGKADFVSCISVLEHVEDEDSFIRDLAFLLAPGGVLFLTVDYDPTDAPNDSYVHHGMRKRIYNFERFYLESGVAGKLRMLGLKEFGGTQIPLHADATTPPPTIPGLGYTFASLCMRKEP